MDIRSFFEYGHEEYLPHLSSDVVVIGYAEEKLKCLLLRIGARWLLPGGFIKLDESVEEAASRILTERTGLNDPHLKFLSVFGKSERNFAEEWKEHLEKFGVSWKQDLWINKRFVSLAYYSLVNIPDTHPVTGPLDEAFGWFDLDELPPMWMDHRDIALMARHKLRSDIRKDLVTHHLLPRHFTMPQLHQLHQVILNKDLDRSRFQKQMLATGFFERLPKLQKETRGRNPYQYRIKENKDH
ncbi:NUDIX hydrolase [Robertkochia marina]|nr:NUDIX domain-containing protein [Robertkochia marina]